MNKEELKKFLLERFKLTQNSNDYDIYTNDEKTVQLEEQEKVLLIRFK